MISAVSIAAWSASVFITASMLLGLEMFVGYSCSTSSAHGT
ncbi:unnamed protein product, partial [Chrysoparadoxa australica]